MFTLGKKVQDYYDVMHGKKVCGRIIYRYLGKRKLHLGTRKLQGHAYKYGSMFGDGPSMCVSATGNTPHQVIATLNLCASCS